MNNISKAVTEIASIDTLARKNTGINNIHPVSKLCVTVLFLLLVISYRGDSVTALLGMALFPFSLFLITGLSVKKAVYRLRIVLPLVCVVGIFNPFFNRTPALTIGSIIITEGVLTMLTLMLKGVLCVVASYLLIATTTVEKICYAMRCFHIPQIIVTEFMLIYRYIAVVGMEADTMTTSYMLRAPGQKGINIKSWGPLVGNLLLKSMDKADNLYQSMCLRGFKQEFPFAKVNKMQKKDWLYLVGVSFGIILLRIFPILEIIGRIFVK